MKQIVGVRLEQRKKIEYCLADQFFAKGEYVVIDVDGYQYLGLVATKMHDISNNEAEAVHKYIVRLATAEDLAKQKHNESEAVKVLEITKKQVRKQQLEMKLLNAEYSFDKQKLCFNFTAENRVDFRELVKILAKIFHTRIELRQVGARDEAKFVGGIGPCGRPICCHSFLGDFIPVSIKMAKNQDLSLNPSKISGLCGRLMCCLKYEDEHYQENKKNLPDLYSYVQTPDGYGEVTQLNFLKQIVSVRLDGFATSVDYAALEVRLVD